MGKGTIEKSTYKTSRGYYLSHNYDERLGGEFDFLIEPLRGNDDELFFMLKKTDNGSYEVTGEGYIITSKESLNRHQRELKNEIRGKTIWYYHIDNNGTVIKKEKGQQFRSV